VNFDDDPLTESKPSGRQIEHAQHLIEKGESRQYVADPLNVGQSRL